MYVTKRDGRREILDISQVRKQTIPACEGLDNVSYETVELNTNIFLYDGIPTHEIQNALIKSAQNLISIKESNYTYVAARLKLYDLYHKIKRLYKKTGSGDVYEKVHLLDYFNFNKDILQDYWTTYTEDEINLLNKEIVSDRDNLFNLGGVNTMMNNYLIKISDTIRELPQHMHMSIAMFIMHKENKDKRLEYVKELYTVLSKLEYINPTPMNANGRLKIGGLVSCLLTTVPDSLDGIMDKFKEIAIGSKLGSGWGIDFSRVRSLGSKIGINKNAGSGKIPFLKVANDLLLAVNQAGRRPGAGSFTISVWDIDIKDFIDLKKKHGDERRRAMDIFPAVALDDVFMERMEKGLDYTLFDPYDCPELTETYGDTFKKWYQHYEEEYKKDPSKFNKNTKIVSTKEIALYIINSYYENGTPFIFFKDNVNKQHRHPQHGIIRSSNLCFSGETRIMLPDENGGWKYDTIRNLAEYSKKEKKFKVIAGEYVNNKWEKRESEAVAFQVGEKEVIMVVLENSTWFKCTPDHYLATKTGKWVQASASLGVELAGYSTKGYDGERVIGIHRVQGKVPVYDLTVDNYHNFYINTREKEDNYQCSIGVLVHNCMEVTLPTTDDLTAVCNLGSLNMSKVNTVEDLERVIPIALRAMDNSIDLTSYPSEHARKFQELYRSTGLGVTGEAEYLATHHIHYGSEEHMNHAELFYSNMSRIAYESSKKLGEEKGTTLPDGCRNAYIMAIAPNSSSGLFASTTNSHEPVYSRMWVESGKGESYKMTAPNINQDNEIYYKTAFEVFLENQIKVNAIRQKYIDMSISFNLYFTPEEISTKKVRDAILLAWKSGLKSLYYLRSKAISNTDIKDKEVEFTQKITSKNGISCVGCEN